MLCLWFCTMCVCLAILFLLCAIAGVGGVAWFLNYIVENAKKVFVPDTASTGSIIMLIIGIVSICGAFSLINKNAK